MTDSSPPRIVIVGAGHAGTTAAVELRSRGFEGEVVLLSEEEVVPYERPPLSKGWLTADDPRKAELFGAETLAQRGIELHLGARVVAIDRPARTVTLADETTMSYDRLVLATGSSARSLPLPGCELEGVHSLRSASDADALRVALVPGCRLVVIGAGYIGLEVAASARQLGLDVTIVELASRPMARTASHEVSAHYRAVHEARGVVFLFEDGITGIDGKDGRAAGVRLGSGRVLPAEVVLLAAGGVPDTALAQAAGLEVESGIVVDDDARTSDPLIHAIGDATSRPSPFAVGPFTDGFVRLESVHNALEQARLMAADVTGTKPPRLEAPWFWSDQYELKLQIAGLVGRDAERVIRREGDGFAVFHLRDEELRAVEAVNLPKAYMVGRKALTSGLKVDRAVLGDPSADLKTALIQTRASRG